MEFDLQFNCATSSSECLKAQQINKLGQWNKQQSLFPVLWLENQDEGRYLLNSLFMSFWCSRHQKIDPGLISQ